MDTEERNRFLAMLAEMQKRTKDDLQLRYPDPVEGMQQFFADIAREFGFKKTDILAKLYNGTHLAYTDWGVGNIAGYDFSGSNLTGSDFRRVTNLELAKFDYLTKTEKALLPAGVTWTQLKFRNFKVSALSALHLERFEDIDFGDLDVAGMDFSKVAGFFRCDMTHVRNISRAKFPILGKGNQWLEWNTFNPSADDLRLPNDMLYSDLNLVPCRFPVKEWRRLRS